MGEVAQLSATPCKVKGVHPEISPKQLPQYVVEIYLTLRKQQKEVINETRHQAKIKRGEQDMFLIGRKAHFKKYFLS